MSRPPTAPRPRPPDPLRPFEDALRERFPSREALLAEARAATRPRRVRPAATAAVLVLALGVGWLDPAWQVAEVRTVVGEQRRHVLPDGSTAHLNTATVLRVERRLRSRQAVLVEGEAAFDVRHGWRPFTVRSADVAVRDIGTAFTVRRQPDSVDVAVLEGRVEVRQGSGPAWRLRAGQALRTMPAAPPVLRRVDVAHFAAWRDGRLAFDGVPLAVALEEIRRYRTGPVVLADPRVGTLRLSAVHDVAEVEALIDALPVALPITVRREPGGRVVIGAAAKKD